MQLKKEGLAELASIEDGEGAKCLSFGASSSPNQHLAVGDFNGDLKIYDVESQKEIYKVKAHKKIVNSLDAIGGDLGNGAPEIVTGSRDGCVRLWDPRQSAPVSQVSVFFSFIQVNFETSNFSRTNLPARF